MPQLPVTQDSNVVHGNLGGRDVNTYNSPVIQSAIINTAPIVSSPLKKLFEHLQHEAEDDKVLVSYIRELEVFTRIVQNEEVVGLENKLHAAKRADQIDMAEALKEMIFAELKANIFSPTFQKIYALLMGKLFEEFETWVKPAIMRGENRSEIDVIVSSKVIQPVIREVELCGDYYGVAPQTIRGMVYFLTGNCHIKWH